MTNVILTWMIKKEEIEGCLAMKKRGLEIKKTQSLCSMKGKYKIKVQN